MKHYGYKLCYTEKGSKRNIKPYFYARSYKQALKMKNLYLATNSETEITANDD